MRFITISDLRSQPGTVWDKLRKDRDLVVTYNGKAIAILTATSEEELEMSLAAIRRARAVQAVTAIQQKLHKNGKSRTTAAQIDSVIRKSRRGR